MEVRLTERCRNRMLEIYDLFYEYAGFRSAENMLAVIQAEYGRLALSPYIGKREWNIGNVSHAFRSLVIHSHYKIVYRIVGDVIYIIDIWDCRQDPYRMKELSGLPEE